MGEWVSVCLRKRCGELKVDELTSEAVGRSRGERNEVPVACRINEANCTFLRQGGRKTVLWVFPVSYNYIIILCYQKVQ